MHNPNVCFFAHSSMLGGAERSLLDLIRGLVQRGVVCSVVMQGDDALKDACEEVGIRVKTVQKMAWWTQSFRDIYHTIEQDMAEMVDFVKEVSADIIYTQTVVNPFGAMVAEKLELPHIWALREYGELDHGLKFTFDFQESMRRLYQTSDVIFSITVSVAQVVLNENAANKNVFVNYSQVEIPSHYQSASIGLFENDVIKIAIFGGVYEGKNQMDALKACIKLHQEGYRIKLFMVGHREVVYEQQLKKVISDHDLEKHVVFVDYINEPISLMSKMDIILSCARSEALGRTLFEAIQLKKPIIYANMGGPKEVFTDEKHGLAYHLYDSDDLAAKIKETIEKKSVTLKRVENAYNYVKESFTEVKYVEPVYREIKKLRTAKPNRERGFVTEFVLENISRSFAAKLKSTEQALLEAQTKTLKQERQLQEKEQKLKEKEQAFYEKELYIKELEVLAQSMRIKNRIKKLFRISDADKVEQR